MNTRNRRQRIPLVVAAALTAVLAAVPAFAQVTMVKDINPGAGESSTGYGATAFGSKILFSADDGTHGIEPWISDGTAEGTFMLADIVIANDPQGHCGGASNPVDFTPVGDVAYFSATDAWDDTYFFCRESVWITDGTSVGTEATSVFQNHSGPDGWATLGQALFVQGWDPEYGEEIWKIDGGNQYMIKNIGDDPLGSDPSFFSSVTLEGLGERLFFSANTFSGGVHPWISAGLPENTEQLKVINEITLNSGTGYFVGFQGMAWFRADDGINGSELWISDGTESGTTLFMDLNPGSASSEPKDFTVVGDRMFFLAKFESYGFQLWVTDGTVENTRTVFDPATEPTPSDILEPIALNGRLYFTAHTNGTGRELWVSDGSAEGTMMVVDLDAGGNSSDPQLLTAADGKLFFSATTPGAYRELWVSNGTAEGTILVEDIYPGGTHVDPHSSSPRDLVATADTLFFFAFNDTVGDELWKLPLSDIVSTPDTPTGDASGPIDTSFSYSTGGSISLEGADVQYVFDWDDGTEPQWLPVGATSADHSWSAPGTYTVTAQARSATETGTVSKVSAGFEVEINDDEIIEAADIIGPTEGWEGVSYEYIFGATSSKDHQLEYSITWGPGETTDWADLNGEPPSVTASHTWTEAGGRFVHFNVRCAADTEFGDSSSISVNISVQPEEEISSAVVTGPTSGVVGTEYPFTLTATTNTDHDLEYQIHWGDGTPDQWVAFGSGLTSIEISHTWSFAGSFPVDAEVRCIEHQIGSLESVGVTIEISDLPPGWIFGDGFESGNLEAW